MAKYKIGLDVGSTTIKTAVLDQIGNLLHSSYDRHYSDIKATLASVLRGVLEKYDDFTVMVTGSGGISVSEWLGIPFIQEVIAGVEAIKTLIPETDVAIELGGEDAKITYLTGGIEQRMNGTCAGGTGAFIDQMASLLSTDASGLNELAKSHTILYPIASRCGVFAKSDIQPLINDGAKKPDIAASVFQSVVNQLTSFFGPLYASPVFSQFQMQYGCESNNIGSCVRQAHTRQRGILGRTAALSYRARQAFYRYAQARKGYISRKQSGV